MAQYESGYPTYEAEPRGRGRWPLAGVFFIDLVIILVTVLVFTTIVSLVFLFINSQREGVQIFDGSLTPEDLIRLIGVPGIFLTLLVQNLIFIAVPLLRVGLLRRESLSTIGFRAPRPLRLVALGIGLGVLTLVSNVAFGALFQSLGVTQNQSDQYPLYAGDYLGQAIFFLGAAVIVPIGEETLFRGYAFNAFRQSWSRFAWGTPLAYILSALLFSLAHGLAATEGVIGLLVPAFIMGLLFAWAMHRTGSLVPSIVAHAMNNGVALVLLTYCINNPNSLACSA